MDVIIRSIPVIFQNFLHHRIHTSYKLCIPGSPEKFINRQYENQGGIRRIVHWLVLPLRKQIRHQPSPAIFSKGL